jgi:glycerol uptake facilitator-like aquaporin
MSSPSIEVLPWNAYAAEFVGTFLFQFFSALITVETRDGLVASAFAMGLTLIVLSYACIGISGAHLNPALTLGVLVSGKCGMSVANGLIFIGCQFFASVFGSFLAKWMLPACALDPATGDFPPLSKCSPDRILTFNIQGSLSADHGLSVFLFEMVCTFGLVWAYFATAVDERSGARLFAPLAVGFAMLAGTIAEGPGTGASMSPARTLGGAIVFGDMHLTIAPVSSSRQQRSCGRRRARLFALLVNCVRWEGGGTGG